MDSQDLERLEDSSVQLCSYSEIMSNSTRTANAPEFREETGNVPNPDTAQIQTAIGGTNVTQMEPMPNSNSCSSHTLSAEADSRSPKRRRSNSSSSFHSSEVAKRQRYGEDAGVICASPRYINREDTLAAGADSGLTRISPPSNGAASSPIYGTEHRPHRTIVSTVEEANVPLRGQMPEPCTLSPFAPRPRSIANSRNTEETSLSPIKDLVKDLDGPDINSASLRYSCQQPMVRGVMFPGLFETRRWGFAKGASNRPAVLVAGDWYPGPTLKPFDPVCYDDNALE